LPAGPHLGRISNIGLSNAACTATPPSGSSVFFEVKPAIETALDTTVCLGQVVKVGTQSYTQSGTYPVLLQTPAGCDSTVTLKLQVATEIKVERTAQFCADDSYNFYGKMLTQGGFYRDTVPGPYGCDSTITLYLSAAPVTFGFETRYICPGETYTLVDGTVVQDAGVYEAKTISTADCDSTITVTLKIRPIAVAFKAAELRVCKDRHIKLKAIAQNCAGCKFSWSTGAKGINLDSISAPQTSTSAVYTVTITDNNMCTASAALQLTVIQPYFIEENKLLCPGETLNLCGQPILQNGEYPCPYTSSEGCDSTVTWLVEMFDPQDFQVARNITVTMPPDDLTWAFDVTHNNNYPTDFRHIVRDPLPSKGKVEVQNDQKLLYTPDPDKRSGLDVVHFALCPPANCPDACSEAVLTINLDGRAVEEIEKKMPNLITLGDDNINAFFDPLAYLKAVEGIEVDAGTEELIIYNRWGEILRHFLEGEYPEKGWDGTDEKGREVPQGTYYYLLKYKYTKAYQRKGPVNVLK